MFEYDGLLYRLKQEGILIDGRSGDLAQRCAKIITKDLPNNYKNPSDHIVCHMNEILKSKGFQGYDPITGEFLKISSRALNGRAFECLFAETLINFFNEHGKLHYIWSLIINSDKAFTEKNPGLKERAADLDLLLEVTLNLGVVFLLKVSTRERWKQWDRDIPIIREELKYPVRIVCVLYREKDVSIRENSIEGAKRIKSRMGDDDVEVISVWDEECMYNLFMSLIREFENNRTRKGILPIIEPKPQLARMTYRPPSKEAVLWDYIQ